VKVYFSNYRNHWLSPYTILEKVFFWREIDYDEPIIEKWSKRLLPICDAWQKFLDFLHPRINYVKIDRYDTWSMDHTLAHIVLPMLKQLKETKHGGPLVDDKDVPKHLKSTSAPPKENDWDVDENHFLRWDYVLDEMIFAFEHIIKENWEKEYEEGTIDFLSVPVDNKGFELFCPHNEVEKSKSTFFQLKEGPNHTFKRDEKAIKEINKRIDNGLMMFGKYYRNLWD